MIHQKITNDIREEFCKLRKDLRIHVEGNFDISSRKQFLRTHIPHEVYYKSKLLLDTLLNYLMEQAMQDLEKADLEVQNAFFEADFRMRVYQWTKQMYDQLLLTPEKIDFSFDPRLKQAFTFAGSFLLGSVTINIFIPSLTINAIIMGISAIIISAVAFKIGYEKGASKSREKIKSDMENYLQKSQKQMNEWAKTVTDTFVKDFQQFCNSKGFFVSLRA